MRLYSKETGYLKMNPGQNRFALLDILKKRKPAYRPVWFMRQAGRVLADYRRLKDRYDFLTLCHSPELATEITLMPVKQLDVDAAILFSDILIPLEAAGVDVKFSKDVTPVVDFGSDFEFHGFGGSLDFMAKTISNIKGELKDRPLLGFSGAPFTLICYLRGANSKNQYAAARKLMYQMPSEEFFELEKMIIDYLMFQIRAGVDAVQLFDSWAGVLPADIYRERIFPSVKRIVSKVGRFAPVIYYAGGGSSHLSELLSKLPANCISCDWRTDIVKFASEFTGSVQGNLDPAIMFADFSTITEKQGTLLKELPTDRYIVNFGHGVLPDTDQEKLKRLVDWIHNQQ